jgi:serine/threonine protein kinase
MSQYTVVRQLGRGGFGIVEHVTNSDGLSLARKRFFPGLNVPLEYHVNLRKRFIREVRIQEQIGGVEIIPVLDHGLSGEEPWFVMPLATKTYQDQILEDKNSGSVTIDAIADILNALEYLHTLEYVHRDLNPRNILFDNGKWKLADLGAVLPPSGQTATLTEDTVIYTEQYCAPEQRNNFHYSKSSADVYSFGCILHDLFGSGNRTPYSKQSCNGNIGHIIEKCTDQNPSKRPNIKALRGLVIEILVELGGKCKVEDGTSEKWLARLATFSSWEAEDFDAFCRFFSDLNVEEMVAAHAGTWTFSLSTPFLTRIPEDALAKIAERKDGPSSAIIEKYCDWAGNTNFLFHFADTVCTRLCAIFDNGDKDSKGMALIALIKLANSHNRFHVMRAFISRCRKESLDQALDKRLAIEIRTADLGEAFGRCVIEISSSPDDLAESIKRCLA